MGRSRFQGSGTCFGLVWFLVLVSQCLGNKPQPHIATTALPIPALAPRCHFHLGISIHMYTCVNAYACIHTYIRIHVHIYVKRCTCVLCMNIFTRIVCIHVYVNVYAYTAMCGHICHHDHIWHLCLQVCVPMYEYICVYLHCACVHICACVYIKLLIVSFQIHL